MLGKRTMDFKVTYLDAGLTSNYFSDGGSGNNGDVSSPGSGGGGGGAGEDQAAGEAALSHIRFGVTSQKLNKFFCD